MLRTIIWLLAAVVILIIMLPFGLIFRLIQLIRGEKYSDPPMPVLWICRTIVPLYTRLAGCDYTVIGSENIPDVTALYVGNHQGALDTFLILFALGKPKIIMAKIETAKIPIAHLFMTLLKCIFIDRQNARKALECIKEAEDYLKHGNSVFIFPEGTRSRGPRLGTFKHGAFKAAIDSGVPIVPVAIDGTYNVYEAPKRLTKASVKFSVLPPVTAAEGEKSKELSERVRGLIAAELERLRNE